MKTKTNLTFKQLLDKTKRNQYVTDSVVESIESSEPQNIELFTLDKYVTANDLETEVGKKGYTLAHPYALALYALEHPELADEHPIGTQWKNADGDFCFAAFYRWSDDWWFAGVRKLDLGTSDTQNQSSNPLNLELRIQDLIPILRINISGKEEELVTKNEVLSLLK